jgi:DNA-binding response OmpR family regulator
MIDNSLGEVLGSEVCKTLKLNNSFNHIPVILCSAVDDLERLSMECNADNYLVKPFNLTELESVVLNAS